MSGLTYPAALAAIAERGRFRRSVGIGPDAGTAGRPGHPERSIRGALVGGTNGKGSVVALAGTALQAAGYRVGLSSKPHLVSYRERLQVDGVPIEPDAFAALIEEVLPVADRVERRLGAPTEFELLTAAIFLWFARQRVDVALVEVGLGGRLDATHAWDGGVAVITNVALDHMDVLGPTIQAIAREKAAIIERGDLAVTGAVAGREVIAARARRLAVPLTIVEAAPLLGWDRDFISVRLPSLGVTTVGLRGRHQAANAAVADALLDALGAAGMAHTPETSRRTGLATARWPGRLELLDVPRTDRGAGSAPEGREVVEVLLDGAHNAAGAAALVRALDDLRPYLRGGRDRTPPPLTLVLGVMADKDVAGIVAALSGPALAGARVVCTQVDVPRALPAEALATAWTRSRPETVVTVESDPAVAFEHAAREAPGTVVVAGSLYLVGQIRALVAPDAKLVDPPARPAAPADRTAAVA